jgi:hypothetical protein
MPKKEMENEYASVHELPGREQALIEKILN